MPTTVNKHPVTDDGFSLTKPVTFPERSVLMGSFHQGHPQFGDAQNKQCGAISLTAVMKSKTKSVLTWNSEDLDDVLVKGTCLYRSMRAQGKIRDHVRGRGYIAVSELPTRHRFWNSDFRIYFSDSFTGFVHVDDYDHAIRDVAMPFDVALQRTLLSNDACLLTICANTCAIVKEGTWFALIDSHANRNVNKKQHMASIVAYFSSAESLYRYVFDFASSVGENTPRFEITGVEAVMIAVSAELYGMCNDAGTSSSYMVNTAISPNSSLLYSDVVKGNGKVYRQQVVKSTTGNGTKDPVQTKAAATDRKSTRLNSSHR